MHSPTFDYIVVGAGSAGCVLANRLSANGHHRVLLLEAGNRLRHPLIAMPLVWLKTSETPRFGWGYTSEPEAASANRALLQPRGKLLGGTSSINGMMYARGNPGDYDGWAQLGLPGWGFEDVLPYFRRAETSWRGPSRYHGDNGPLHVAPNPTDPQIYPSMIAAAERLGYRQLSDMCGAEVEGFGMPDFASHHGRRESTATAYLLPVMGRHNLKVATGALLTRIVLEGERATGVEYSQNGRTHAATAGEVIVAGGAFNSPQMLMLSGIGPAQELRDVGIKPLHDLAGVGRNLQDHPIVAAIYKASGRYGVDDSLRLDRLAASLLQWAVSGRGLIATHPLSVQGFLRTHSDSAWPDTQFHVSHVSWRARPWFPGWRAGAGHEFTAAAIQLRPTGRGDVKLRTANPQDAPRIRLGLLEEATDRRAARDMLRFIRRFWATDPAAKLISAELAPGPAAQSDAELDAYIRATVHNGMHPTGTCAMGTDARAVVDAELRVHGLKGLRVVDASVMPNIVSGNTNAPTIMIAEKASDLILGLAAPGRTQELPEAHAATARAATG